MPPTLRPLARRRVTLPSASKTPIRPLSPVCATTSTSCSPASAINPKPTAAPCAPPMPSSDAAVGFGFIAEAGEQLVEVVAQTGDSGRIGILEALCKLTCSRASCRGVGGIHDPVQGPFDLRLIGFANLVEEVPDLVAQQRCTGM